MADIEKDGLLRGSDSVLYIKDRGYGGMGVYLNPTNNGISTGSMQEILLPEGVSANAIMIQVHNGSVSDFTSYASNPIGFHFSSSGSASGKDFINCVGSFTIDLHKEDEGSIGFVRATSGNYITLTVLN